MYCKTLAGVIVIFKEAVRGSNYPIHKYIQSSAHTWDSSHGATGDSSWLNSLSIWICPPSLRKWQDEDTYWEFDFKTSKSGAVTSSPMFGCSPKYGHLTIYNYFIQCNTFIIYYHKTETIEKRIIIIVICNSADEVKIWTVIINSTSDKRDLIPIKFTLIF